MVSPKESDRQTPSIWDAILLCDKIREKVMSRVLTVHEPYGDPNKQDWFSV